MLRRAARGWPALALASAQRSCQLGRTETGYHRAICRSRHAAFRNRHRPRRLRGPTLRIKAELVPTRWRETMTITSHGARERMIVTASLTSGIACVAHGMTESVKLIDEITAHGSRRMGDHSLCRDRRVSQQ